MVAITDGDRLLTRVRDRQGSYAPADRFPPFHSLQAGRLPPVVYEKPRGVRRPTFAAIRDGNALDGYQEEDLPAEPEATPPERMVPYLNLVSLLLDTSELAEPGALGDGWQLVQDRGLIDTNFGNAGFTSHAFQGYYRGLKLLDAEGNACLPLLRIFAANYSDHRPRVPMLAVGFHRVVDGRSKHNHALQLNLERNLLIEGKHVRLVHQGRIGLGEGGGVSGATTRALIAGRHPDLVDGERIEFGTLPNDRLVRWDDALPVFLRMIRYALACEEVRGIAREDRGGRGQPTRKKGDGHAQMAGRRP